MLKRMIVSTRINMFDQSCKSALVKKKKKKTLFHLGARIKSSLPSCQQFEMISSLIIQHYKNTLFWSQRPTQAGRALRRENIRRWSFHFLCRLLEIVYVVCHCCLQGGCVYILFIFPRLTCVATVINHWMDHKVWDRIIPVQGSRSQLTMFIFFSFFPRRKYVKRWPFLPCRLTNANPSASSWLPEAVTMRTLESWRGNRNDFLSATKHSYLDVMTNCLKADEAHSSGILFRGC